MNPVACVSVSVCFLVISFVTPYALGNEAGGVRQSRASSQWDQQTTQWNPRLLFRQKQVTPCDEEGDQYGSVDSPQQYQRSMAAASPVRGGGAVPLRYYRQQQQLQQQQQQPDCDYDAGYGGPPQPKSGPDGGCPGPDGRAARFTGGDASPYRLAYASAVPSSPDEQPSRAAGGFSYAQPNDHSDGESDHRSTPRNPFLAYTQAARRLNTENPRQCPQVVRYRYATPPTGYQGQCLAYQRSVAQNADPEEPCHPNESEEAPEGASPTRMVLVVRKAAVPPAPQRKTYLVSPSQLVGRYAQANAEKCDTRETYQGRYYYTRE